MADEWWVSLQSHPQSSAPQPPSTLLCQGTSRTPLPRTNTTTSLCIIHHQLHTTRVSLLLCISPLPLPQVLLLFFTCFLECKKSISHKSTLASDLGAKLSSLSILPWVRGAPWGCRHPRNVVLSSLPGWRGSCSASARCGWRTSPAPSSGSAGSGASEQPQVPP